MTRAASLVSMPFVGAPFAAWVLALWGSVTLVGAFLLRRRSEQRARRERELQAAVLVRTQELERERLRELARNTVLEQVVGNQPLGGVLDTIAVNFRQEAPGTLCCLLLRRHASWHLGAAPGLPAEWIASLRGHNAVPYDIPPEGRSWQDPGSAPEWAQFLSPIAGLRPFAIHARRIGNADSHLGVLLAFETHPESPSGKVLEPALHAAAQLAFVAIEHWRFYEDLRHRAHHDSLTGLPNRVLLEERLLDALQEAEMNRKMMALLSIDVDRFKRVNDALGHRSADVVLSELGARIRKTLRSGDTVARVGGDEFMVIVGNIQKPTEVDEVSGRILDMIRQPILVDGKAVSPTASIGSALFPPDAMDSEGLRRKADAAMQCAKSLGRNRAQSFGARIDLLDRVRLEEEVRDALEFNRLSVHYQPKIGAAGAFCGLEALVRLTSVVHGSLSPASFIPVAEESGLIIQLGAWVLGEVCAQMLDWHQRGLGWVPVAVNVSPAQISRPGFATEVRKCLHQFGVPASSLELELTESIVLGGGEEGERQMRELRATGIKFSIDDFGTGYSSLSYLYRLPVDAIKLDRSFVQAISTDQAARRLVQAMIGVAEGLGLNVVAEGVETEDQRVALIAAGCPVMQGYLFARPAPAPDVERFLHRDEATHHAAAGSSGSPSAAGDLHRLGEAVASSALQPV